MTGKSGNPSLVFSGNFKAPGSQAMTQGQSSQRWQPLLSKSMAGVAMARVPSRAGKLKITWCGQASTHLPHRVQANKKSSSCTA
jgi:hypothetical protein